jgi:hypothetical protein
MKCIASLVATERYTNPLAIIKNNKMKRNFKFGILMLTAIIILSCKSDSKEVKLPSSPNHDIFVVDKDFCKEMGLPIIEFSLEYPKELKTDLAEKGYQNFNYNAFFKWNENEVQTEGISLGYYTPPQSDLLEKQVKQNLLNQVLGAYQQMFEISDAKISTFEFDNKEYLMLRAKGKAKDPDPEPEFVGNYLIQTLLLEPLSNNKNGLLVTFIANEESEIKSFENFADKGYISKVWKTLKFE